MCFDDEGSSKFSCDCKPRYLGERCENDRCDFYQCQNNGTCIVALINDIPTPECECQGNYGGATCNLDLCSGIECDNGTCIRGLCQCSNNYVNIGNSCEQTCALANCKVGDTIFQNFEISPSGMNCFYPTKRMGELVSMMMVGYDSVANVLVLLVVKHVR